MTRQIASPSDRFWSRVDTSGTCWLWTGATQTRGYGSFSLTRRTSVLAHRFAFEDVHGPIPSDLTLDHLCEVKRCVNPDHLEVVSRAENARRHAERHRGSCYCGSASCISCRSREVTTEKVRRHRQRARAAS